MQSTSKNQVFIKELTNNVRDQEERSFLSKMTIFLTKICMIPVKLDLKLCKADWSVFSLRTMIFFVVYVVGSIFIIAVFIPLFKEHYANMVSTFFAVNNTVDIVSNIFFYSGHYLLNPLFLLILASSFQNLEKLSMNQQLNYPKNGGCLISALSLVFLGSFLIFWE